MIDSLKRWNDFFRIQRRGRLSLGSVFDYQNRKLRRLVEHAYHHVAHYRALLDKAGLRPEDIREVSDLARFPLTTKKDLRKAAAKDLLSDSVRPAALPVFKTTGSTGVPLIVRRSKAEDFLFHLIRMRTIRSYGLRVRDHVVRLRSGNLDHVPLSWRLARALGLFRQSIVNTEGTPQKNAADLLALRPDVLTGYNSSLARIARIITLDHKTVLPLRFVVGGADMLTPLLRKQIQEAFETKVSDSYECVELGMIAWECLETGLYHVCDDNVILEVLADGRPAREGERGEVVVTSLHLQAMPFIRYRLEDIVTVGPSTCPCGRPFRTLKTIEAKKQDYFRLPGGHEFYPWSISLLLIDIAPWVLQFQLVQERVDRVVMRAEALTRPSDDELARVQKEVRPLLGPAVEFEIEIVPELKPTPGGKFWMRRSLVNSMYEDADGSPDRAGPEETARLPGKAD